MLSAISNCGKRFISQNCTIRIGRDGNYLSLPKEALLNDVLSKAPFKWQGAVRWADAYIALHFLV